MKKLKLRTGFTIAELTIATLLIAGIAMIMMPSLRADNERQVYATSLKKIYTDLQQTNQAIGLLIAKGEMQSGLNAISAFKIALLKTKKMVNTSTYNGYLRGYKPQIDPAVSFSSAKPNEDIFILKNGMFLFFDKDNNFVIDINGKKQPNMTGKDIFYFTIEANSNLQGENFITINPLNSNCPKGKSSCTTPVNCKGCAKRILEETGRIDYF